MTVIHFTSRAEFRRWLATNHATVTELWVGFYNKASRRGGLTYAEAVEEALCFGWIDGIIRKIDEHSYTHRLTPRRPRSTWSLVNVRHVERLTAAGRMHAAGLAAFERRDAKKTGVYSFEQRPRKFPIALEKIFRTAPAAWTFWQSLPPGYQRMAIWWVVSAKQADTRHRRLATLIAKAAARQRLT